MSYAESPSGRDLALARNTAQHWFNKESQRHKTGKEAWGLYNNDHIMYDQYFSNMLPFGGFVDFIDSMQKEVAIIDAFAPSSFIRSITNEIDVVRCGIALSLGDLRSQEEKKEDARRGILQIKYADMYSSKLWIDQVKSHLSNYGKEKADLVVCAPCAGWYLIGDNKRLLTPSSELMWLVTNRLWSLLNTDGFLFINFSTDYYDVSMAVDNWCCKLAAINMDIIGNEIGSVRLKKTATSPKTLPSMKPLDHTHQFLA